MYRYSIHKICRNLFVKQIYINNNYKLFILKYFIMLEYKGTIFGWRWFT